MRRLSLFVPLALFSCVPESTGNPPATGKPSATTAVPPPPSSAPVVVADAAAPSGEVVIAPPSSKWRSAPKPVNGFYAALDGICSQLGAARVGKDVVIHYGGGALMKGQREGLASFIGLHADRLEPIGDPGIASPTGIAGASLEDFWIADSTGSRSSEGAVLHRRSAGKWNQYAKDQTNLHAWVDGGIIGSLGFAISNGEVWVEGSTTKPPAALSSNLGFPSLSAFPTGASRDTRRLRSRRAFVSKRYLAVGAFFGS